MSIATSIRQSLPSRALSAGLHTTFTIAAIPVREGVRALSADLSPETLRRHCWRGANRAWIEVRGLADAADGALGRAVLDAVLAHPGVTSAKLNYPLSRVVVGINDRDIPLGDLCRIVEEAEKRCPPSQGAGGPTAAPTSLPGDGVVLATRAVTVAVNAAGLGIALTGRAMRLPRAPITVLAGVSLVNYQPWLRRLLEDRIGGPATDTVLTLTSAAAETITQSPMSLSVGLTMQSLKAAECRAEAQAWQRHEPALALHADQPPLGPGLKRARQSRPGERHARRLALLQALSAGLIGAGTRDANMAATAALVTAPKANRTTPEAFAAALGRGLAERHAVLPLRPEALRRLDQVDAIVIDPRILSTETLRVARIRGADDDELSAAWNRAQLMLEKKGLRPGWRPVSGMAADRPNSTIEALFLPAHDPLASAVVAEAHRSGTDLVSVDVESLDELRPAFDDVRPVRSETAKAIDDALARAVADLRKAGRTVAVLSSSGARAMSSADVALGVLPRHDGDPPPWHADLLLPDLGAAWRVLHALPAARTATQQGLGISAAATAMGSLFLIPGVRGVGRGPVNIGAAAGLLSGYLLARGILGADTPRPAAVREWHAMSVEQVRKALPAAHSETPTEPHPVRRGAPASETPVQAVWQLAKAVRAELSDPLTPVMALGSAASAVLGSPVDAVLVGTVLTGNSILAAAQRLRAEKRLHYLLAQQTPPARKVVTGADGQRSYSEVIAEQLRPGDLIEVRTHEVVPADARILDEVDVEVDESTLTGESLSVEKQVDATPGAPLAERRCMLYAGTTLVAGTAVALVTAVGRRYPAAARGRPHLRRAVVRHRPAASARPTHHAGASGQRDRRCGGRRARAAAPHPTAACGVQRHRHRGGRGPRGHALGGDAGAVGVGAAIDQIRCAGSGSAFGRGTRPHRCGLLRQDRNAQREPPPGVPGPPRGRLLGPGGAALRGARRPGDGWRPARARHRCRHRRGGRGRRCDRQRLEPRGPQRPPAVPVRQVVLGLGDRDRADGQGRARGGAGRVRGRCGTGGHRRGTGRPRAAGDRRGAAHAEPTTGPGHPGQPR